MSFFLNKVLVLFIVPLGMGLLMAASVLVLEFGNSVRIRRTLLAFMLLMLWIAATPLFAGWLTWQVASTAYAVNGKTEPRSDAVVLLGGTPSSRIVHTLRLYHAGKASNIIVTGGNMPWQVAKMPEAQRVADLLVELGAPPSAVVAETKSRNTRENAVNTAIIFAERGWREGLLVTSSIHMPRAIAAFEQAGLKVAPAPTDLISAPTVPRNLLDVLPDANALSTTTFAVKELIGLYIYRLRGWA